MKARYQLLTPKGREGPYTEEDLLDLLDGGLVDREMMCQDESTGTRKTLGEMFEVITPSGPAEPPLRRSPTLPSARTLESEDLPEDDQDDVEETAPPSPARQHTDNTILFRGHPSILIYWRSLTFTLACVAAAWHFADQSGTLLLAGLMSAGLLLYFLQWRRSRCVYLVTPKRVEVLTGLLSRSSREVRIADIRSINVVQSGLRSLLGVGSVEFSSAATEGIEVAFRNVRRAHRIKELVRRLQDRR